MTAIVRFPPVTTVVDSPPEQERRRDSLFLHATLHLADEPTPRAVRVRNLSARGVMVEAGRDVAVGTTARIDLRGIGDVAGTVVWSVDDRIGIALDRTIDPRRARKPVGSSLDSDPTGRMPSRR